MSESFLIIFFFHRGFSAKHFVMSAFSLKTYIILFFSTRITKGARNPNLQPSITHARHVFNQHSFGLPLRVNENAQNITWSLAFWTIISLNLIMFVLTFYHVNFSQRLSKSCILTFDRSSLYSLTFGDNYLIRFQRICLFLVIRLLFCWRL